MPLFDSFGSDARVALRTLIRDRGFTVTALLTFALCLGANLALFAVVNAALLQPLPFPESHRLVTVGNLYPKAGVTEAIGTSVPIYLDLKTGIKAFADAAAYRDSVETIGESGSPDQIRSMQVTPSFFSVLQQTPAIGRTFSEEEGQPDQGNVVVLSDSLWRSKFGARPDIIDQSLRMGSGRACTVIGVMPPGFRFLDSKAQVWTPLAFGDNERKPEQRHSNNMAMIARLAPEASISAAQAQIDAQNLQSLAGDPYAKIVTEAGFRTLVRDLHASTVERMKPVLLLLQAGVLCLLLIGMVNLTNLFLVRVSGRTKEIGVRQVLGASGGRIARLFLTETMVIAGIGGLLGLGVGWTGLQGLNVLAADQLPLVGPLHLDPLVAGTGLLASLVVGLLLALPLIWHSRHQNLAATLAVESRGGTTSRATHRLRHALIVAQFALAFVLLAGAGLLGLSFVRVLSVDPGFHPTQVLSGSYSLPRERYREDKVRIGFTDRLLRELVAIPGVTAAGISTCIPFGDNVSVNGITVLGYEPKPGESLLAHFVSGVTGDYFKAVGIPLREGRLLNSDDTARADRVCVIDEVVARKYWPGSSALGHELINGVPEEGEKPFTIVGVVGSVTQRDLADAHPKGAIYLPYALYSSRNQSVVIRTGQAPLSVGPALRAAVLRLDPDLPLAEMKTMDGRIEDSLVNRRSPLLLAAIFAGVALLLAGVGLYGVLAYTVAQRRREIGVRMALGAQPEQIRTQFLGLGTKLVATGIVVGVIGTWFTGRAMNTLLFGVGTFHLGVVAVTATILIAIALIACLLPAVRAARVPPMEALRSD